MAKPTFLHFLPVVLALFAQFATAENVLAQSVFGSQGSGILGMNGLSMGGGGVGMSGTGMSLSASGMGGMGTGVGMGVSAGGLGANGAGNTGAGQAGNAGAATRFVGANTGGQFTGMQNRQPNAGNNAAGNNRNQANGNNRNATGANAGRGGARTTTGANAQPGNGNNANSSSRRRSVVSQQRVAFAYPAPSPQAVARTIDARFDKLSVRLALKGVELEAAQGQMILRGTVASVEARQLAENLVRLEPGVRSIKNELTVQGSSVPAETSGSPDLK